MKKELILKQLNEIADDFYQDKIKTGIKEMPSLIKCMAEFIETQPLSTQKSYYSVIKNLFEAYESKNYVMVADMLIYDVACALCGEINSERDIK